MRARTVGMSSKQPDKSKRCRKCTAHGKISLLRGLSGMHSEDCEFASCQCVECSYIDWFNERARILQKARRLKKARSKKKGKHVNKPAFQIPVLSMWNSFHNLPHNLPATASYSGMHPAQLDYHGNNLSDSCCYGSTEGKAMPELHLMGGQPENNTICPPEKMKQTEPVCPTLLLTDDLLSKVPYVRCACADCMKTVLAENASNLVSCERLRHFPTENESFVKMESEI
ncbi:uncharacterized protein LOC116601394 [Nematostella vectensis]|uniref:uncharacterized protein LOC116601394 n=1 Tax=Nematostella vectensis TaxID=45351 RepID=UPI00207791DC|nr:uncharacterized protein LOC116601394 [Nematostella vectensis]